MLHILTDRLFRRSASLLILVSIAGMAGGAATALAQSPPVLYVDAAAPEGGDGGSWATAFCYLQDALSIARQAQLPSCEIRVAQGVYRPDQGNGILQRDREAVFQVPAGTTLLGGFAGRDALVPDARDPEAWPTVLSGDLDETGLPPGELAPYSYGVVEVASATISSPVLLDGLRLTGALHAALYGNTSHGLSVSGCEFKNNGGALHIVLATVTISNCSFVNNIGGYKAPVIRSESSSLILSDCQLGSNSYQASIAQFFGSSLQMIGCTVSRNRSPAAILDATNCQVQIDGCVFDANRATATGPGSIPPLSPGSGTLRVSGGQLTVEHSRFTSNQTTGGGGGIATDEPVTCAISDCEFRGNTAATGGAVYVQNGKPVFTRCRFESNTAMYTLKAYSPNGGAVSYLGSATFTDCTFVGNTTAGSGGALDCNGPLTLTNCLLVGNSSGGCGQALYGAGEAVLTHCLATGNEDPSYPYPGYHGYICWDLNSTFTAYNSILWNGPVPSEVPLSATNCCIQDEAAGDGAVYPGTGNIDVFPEFALADDFHLMGNSPCIDAGGSEPPGGLPPADLDGSPRVLDGNQDGSAVPDMGPYEYNAEVPRLAVTEGVELFVPHGTVPAPVLLSIRNCGGGTLDWAVDGAADWLSVVPDSGSLAGLDTAEVSLTVDTAAMDPGTRVCNLTVEAPGAANPPRVVTVTLHVTAPFHVPWTHVTIQQAIDAAPSGSTVLVADGVYSGFGNRNLDLRGKALTVTSENGPDATILEGEGASSAFRFVNQPADAAVIDGFTIRHGGPPAIICNASHPTVTHCRFEPDWAVLPDKPSTTPVPAIQLTSSNAVIRDCVLNGFPTTVISCEGGAPSIENCEIAGNVLIGDGGVILASQTQLTLTGCRLTKNQSQGGSALHCGIDTVCTLNSCELTGNYSDAYGGAVRGDYWSSIGVADSLVAGNRAAQGGGIHVVGGSLTLTRCDLRDNKASEGGAVYGLHADVMVDRCAIQDNVAGWSSGGAVSCAGDLVVRDSTFTGNGEAGVRARWGTVALERCLFEGNVAYRGGAVCGDGTFDIRQCEFRANRAYTRGGALCVNSSYNVTVRDSLFTSNASEYEGGTAFCTSNSMSFVNCIVSGNTSGTQAAGFQLNGLGPTLISNCAFIGNRTSSGAGGLLFTATGPLELVNSVFWGNSAQSGPQATLVWLNTANRMARCVVEGGRSGIYSRNTLPDLDLIEDDPLFARNGRWDEHGTPGYTADDEWIEGDYVLAPGSPCIDAGDSAALPADVNLDLAGKPRFVDDLLTPDTGMAGDAGVVVDIGPYEFQTAVLGRYVFYNNSAFDGRTPGADPADDEAIATDKKPLPPGQLATVENCINYSRGINGIMIDILNAPAAPVAADFEFTLLGRDGKQSVPASAPISITLRPGAGANASDRITLIWADNAIPNSNWLRVRVKADSAGGHLGLEADDVFHFGLAIGDTGTPAGGLWLVTDATDEISIRSHPTKVSTIDSPFDCDRNRRVDWMDEQIARAHRTSFFQALCLVSLP